MRELWPGGADVAAGAGGPADGAGGGGRLIIQSPWKIASIILMILISLAMSACTDSNEHKITNTVHDVNRPLVSRSKGIGFFRLKASRDDEVLLGCRGVSAIYSSDPLQMSGIKPLLASDALLNAYVFKYAPQRIISDSFYSSCGTKRERILVIYNDDGSIAPICAMNISDNKLFSILYVDKFHFKNSMFSLVINECHEFQIPPEEIDLLYPCELELITKNIDDEYICYIKLTEKNIDKYNYALIPCYWPSEIDFDKTSTLKIQQSKELRLRYPFYYVVNLNVVPMMNNK